MALTEHQRHVRVTIDGVVVGTTVDVTITESIDNLCTVAELTLAAMPFVEPAVGDDVLIEWITIAEDLVYPLFGGTISAIDVESDPWALVCRCVDQLELLRKIKNSSDLVFGEPDGTPAMTEGEAVMEVLDYCGVSYDPADIADTGYVLGVRERVSWLRDFTTSGAQIVAELNRVFRMSLFTIGNNRVIRLPYDPTPSTATGLYATYTKGVSIDFQAHHRTYGDRDRVQNVWVVRGVTAETSASCTEQVWAKAEDGGLLVGSSRRARVATQEFQSDLIQSEPLAEAIVRSLMQQTNRLPDTGTATLENDPNVHQCSKIAIVDPTYGINAAPRYYLVRAVNRSGVSTTLDLTAGPGGSDGTVTTGVDRVCTDIHTDVSWPGAFTFPAFDFPPLDLGSLIDFSFPDFAFGFDIMGGELDVLPVIYCDTDAYSDALAIEADADWQISGTLTLTNTNQRLRIGVTSDDGDYVLTIAGLGYYDGLPAEPERYEMQTPTQLRHMIGSSPLNTPISWLLRWTDANSILQCQISTGDFVVDDFASYPAATMANAETVATVSGAPTRASETVYHDCTDTPPPSDDLLAVGFVENWIEIDPTFSGGPGELVLDQNGSAYYPVSVDPTLDWTIRATVVMHAAAADHDFAIGTGNISGTEQYGVNVLNTADPFMYTVVFGGGDFMDGPPFDDETELEIVLEWTFATLTLDISVSDGIRTEVDSIVGVGVPGFAVKPMIRSAGDLGDTGGITVSAFTLEV